MKRKHINQEAEARLGVRAAARLEPCGEMADSVYPTCTHRAALPPLESSTLERLHRDCATVYTYVEGSMWLAADAAPRCMIESLAAAVFKRHTRGLVFDRTAAGAEFWVQVRMPSADNDGDPVDFHWDVDEHLQDEHRATVTPHLSTVTYLCDGGAPTVLVDDVHAPERYRVADVYGTVESATLSFPRLGKHLVFDGRVLHGAVPVSAATPSEPRITLLVNIWLEHHPSRIAELNSQLAARLTPPPKARSAAAAAVHVFSGGKAGEAIGPPDAPRAVTMAAAASNGANRSAAGRTRDGGQSSNDSSSSNSSSSSRVLISGFGRSEPPRHALSLLLPKADSELLVQAEGGADVGCDTLVLSYHATEGLSWIGPAEAGVESSEDESEGEGKVVVEEEEGDDDEDGEEEDDEDEDEDEDEDHVECDGRHGKGKDAVACGKRLMGDDLVFTSSFGRDYCAECHARLGREGMRQTTAVMRIQEVAELEGEGEGEGEGKESDDEAPHGHAAPAVSKAKRSRR